MRERRKIKKRKELMRERGERKFVEVFFIKSMRERQLKINF